MRRDDAVGVMPARLVMLFDIVKRAQIDSLFRLAGNIEGIVHTAVADGVFRLNTPAELRVELVEAIDKQLMPRCKDLDLVPPTLVLKRLRRALMATELLAMFELSLQLQEFRNSVHDSLQSSDADLFENPALFGGQGDDCVTERFPSAAFDLEEGASCLATNRFTACVFHMARAVEVALRVLGRNLGITASSPNWGVILAKGDALLASNVASRPDLWNAKASFYAEAIKNLRAVKEAWRNPTMHVEAKYTPGHARDIFTSVRIFMRSLATALSETAEGGDA